MRSLIFLLALLLKLSVNAQNSNTYAIFSESPEKRISYTNLSENNYFIEFKTKKKAIICLELIKDDVPIATSRKMVKSKESKIIKLNLHEKIDVKARPGSGYFLKLRMYEGEFKNTKNLVSEVIVEDVNLTRLLYTKL